MSNRTLLWRSASYCLSAALLLAVGASGSSFAAPPEHAQGNPPPHAQGNPPGHDKKPIVLQDLSTFYVGGTIEFSDCNDSSDCDSARFGPGNISVNAVYVEKATPAKNKYKYPIVLMHGGGHNGQVFRTTPDGREGWFTSFIRRGFEVYVVDGSNRGRAGWDPVKRILATAGFIDASEMEPTNTYSEHSGWTAFRWGPEHGVLYDNSQFPIDALNQYLPQLNPAYRDAEANDLLAANISALIDKIGDCILVGWSTGGLNVAMSMASAPERAAKVKAFISVEGVDAFVRSDERDAAVATRPYLNILGDRSDPQPSIDLVADLDELEPGVPHETIYLPDVGIEGNGHTMMLELNNEQIADLIENWIEEHVE